MKRLAAISMVAVLGVAAETSGERCDFSRLERTIAEYPAGQPVKPLQCYRDLPGATEYLVGVLADAGRAASWPMAVTVLGAIGDEASYTTLVNFLAEQHSVDAWGRMTPQEFSAKVDAVLMLGYVRRYSPDHQVRDRATGLLKDLSLPQGWRQHGWVSPRHGSRAASNAYLAGIARFALQQ